MASDVCERLHHAVHALPTHGFPLVKSDVPQSGIYILFEVGEIGHGGLRIVRIGTHKGDGRLWPRLRQHFVSRNKDGSIFRKNLGRALLGRDDDPFLDDWNLNLSVRENRQRYGGRVDPDVQRQVEQRVSDYIQTKFQFVLLEVSNETERLFLESRLTSTVSNCSECAPSEGWLGSHSPVEKIRESGLWQVMELYKESFSDEELDDLVSRVLG